MSDDLVTRLRQLGDRTGLMFVDYDTTIEAADRIETLEAALRKIKWIATPDHEEARYKATEIARKALEEKDE